VSLNFTINRKFNLYRNTKHKNTKKRGRERGRGREREKEGGRKIA